MKQSALLSGLYDHFPGLSQPEFEPIPSKQMPEPYRSLLVHQHHMTVTVEQHYRDSVDVQLLASTVVGSQYSRQIVLKLHTSGLIVQYGIVSIHLDRLHETVREEVLRGQTPLGRILIENNVMRTIEPQVYYKVTPDENLLKCLNSKPIPHYGRLGIITADGHPAITVLEILSPVD